MLLVPHRWINVTLFADERCTSSGLGRTILIRLENNACLSDGKGTPEKKSETFAEINTVSMDWPRKTSIETIQHDTDRVRTDKEAFAEEKSLA
jgi:hypothetical protein